MCPELRFSVIMLSCVPGIVFYLDFFFMSQVFPIFSQIVLYLNVLRINRLVSDFLEGLIQFDKVNLNQVLFLPLNGVFPCLTLAKSP